MKEIVVIGAGLGGLATACRLAKAGHSVTVIEKNETVGGKVNIVETGGYKFDTGASLVTLPETIKELFGHCGANLDDYLELQRLDVICRYNWPDGTSIDTFSDVQRTSDEISKLNPEDGQAFLEYLEDSKTKFEIAERTFLEKSLNELSSLFKPSNIPDLLRISSFRTLASLNASRFKSDKVRQLFDRFATYNGSSPYKVPATFSLIPWTEFGHGAWYVKGGIHEIPKALASLAQSLGVRLFTGTEVKSIIVRDGVVTGIKAAEETFRADAVVSNADAVETHRRLLDSELFSDREPSCSGFVLLLGTKKKFDTLSHHNIFFSGDYGREFEEIFGQKRPATDPTIYICATSRTDSAQAPPGRENLFVLVNAPYTSPSTDWRVEARDYRNLIIKKLENAGLEDLGRSIEVERMITPADFETRYHANRGSIYGLSSNGIMAAFKRVPNRSKDFANLYFVGGAAHPGGGIPLVLLSAKMTSDLLVDDLVRR
jgi:phytoene desaturase